MTKEEEAAYKKKMEKIGKHLTNEFARFRDKVEKRIGLRTLTSLSCFVDEKGGFHIAHSGDDNLLPLMYQKIGTEMLGFPGPEEMMKVIKEAIGVSEPKVKQGDLN